MVARVLAQVVAPSPPAMVPAAQSGAVREAHSHIRTMSEGMHYTIHRGLWGVRTPRRTNAGRLASRRLVGSQGAFCDKWEGTRMHACSRSIWAYVMTDSSCMCCMKTAWCPAVRVQVASPDVAVIVPAAQAGKQAGPN